MHALLLKAVATLVTFGTAVSSAFYVTGHLKTAAAPLHPAVVSAASTESAGRLTLTPSIRSANVEAVTSTYAS